MRKERIVFDYRHYFLRSVVFLYYHLGENGFLILLGVVTGLVTGVGAGAMKLGAARLSEVAPYLRDHGWLLPALLLPAALTIIATAVSIPLSLKFYRENR